MIDVTRLKVFMEVARQGSFTEAASRLSLTQPAVSHHVATLERELGGVRLLDRSTRKVTITPIGQILADRARPLLAELSRVHQDIESYARAHNTSARLAVFPDAAAGVLPNLLEEVRTNHPGLRLVTTQQEPEESARSVAAGTVDAAVVYDYPILGDARRPSGLPRTVLADDELLVVIAATEAGEGPVTVAELADRDWIVPPSGPDRKALEAVLGRTPAIAAETGDPLTAQAMVAAGLGVALVPQLALTAHTNAEVTVRHVADPRLVRRISVLTRSQPSPATRRLTTILDSVSAEIWPPTDRSALGRRKRPQAGIASQLSAGSVRTSIRDSGTGK
jgi:DNA-binding transcriptional LysR family regulator